MERNVGSLDRIMRIVIGLALLAGFLVDGQASRGWLYLIGFMPLLTGVFGTCPVYSLLGISTCRISR